jgi:hypothetical protein
VEEERAVVKRASIAQRVYGDEEIVMSEKRELMCPEQ